MCGIAGVIGHAPAEARPALDRMRVALRHRGPDDEDCWWSPSGAAALAHTRLAVIDIGPGGHQPMSTPDGRFTVTFGGEIYNFVQLRRELEQQGVRFLTKSDTEVLLRGFERHGAGVVHRLRGMFAFAVWDEHERTCTLARDGFGQKPLYYHQRRNGALVFASEVRALMASRLVPRELDGAGVYGYLRAGTVPEPHTLLRNVSALEAGHTMTWRGGAVGTRRFWSPQFPSIGAPSNHHTEAARAALADSVDRHLVSDVPVAVLLSGGVDSAALLALAGRAGHDGVVTVSMAMPGSAVDEGPLARQTADRFAARHLECAIDARGAKALFPGYLQRIDQPSIDGFNTFVVARHARHHGIKVLLSGVGADELFGGYTTFARIPRITAWNARLGWAGALRHLGGRAIEQYAVGPRWRRVGDLLQQAPTLANTYAAFRGIFTRREARQLASHYGVDVPISEPAVEHTESPTDADEVSRLELTHYVRNQLVRDGDAASMACGVELRAPFLDTTLFDVLSRIPSSERLASAKRFLRDAVTELPPWVTGPKRCFQFPFDAWVSGEWRPVFAEVEQNSPVPTETWYRKMCLHVLDHWIDRMKSDGR